MVVQHQPSDEQSTVQMELAYSTSVGQGTKIIINIDLIVGNLRQGKILEVSCGPGQNSKDKVIN